MMRRVIGLAVVAVVSLSAAACSKDPEKLKRQHVQRGDEYLAKKQYPEAIIEYRNAVAQDARFGEARFKLAEAYERAGDPANALREYVRAADLRPNDVEAQVRAGNALLLSRQYPEARARATAALTQDPKNVRALIILGNALAGMRDLDEAIQTVEQAVDQNPEQVLAYTNLGALQAVKGDREAALQTLTRATQVAPEAEEPRLALANFYWASGRFSEAEQELRTVVAKNPKSIVANRALAVLLASTGRLDESEPYLEAYATLNPDYKGKLVLADYYVRRNQRAKAERILREVAATDRGFIPATLRMASIQYVSGDRNTAHKTLEEALKKDAKHEQANVQKGRFLLADGKPRQALDQANATLAEHPNSASALYVKGVALKTLGRASQSDAVNAFQEMLRLEPSSVPAMLQLADLYLLKGDTQRSIEYASQALRRDPRIGIGHLVLAKALVRAGDLRRAEPEVLNLVKGSPKSADVQVLLGDFQTGKKNPAAAREAYAHALELDPNSLDALTGSIRMDIASGRADAARASIEAQLAKRPDHEGLLALAGTAYLALGDPQRAETLFRRLIVVNPSNMPAYGALASIYMRQQRLDEARHEFEEAARRDTKTAPAALTMVGTILMLQGKNDEARKQFESVMALDPGMPIAANNLAWNYAERGQDLDAALQLAQTAKSKLPDSPNVSDTLGWVYYKKGMNALAVSSLEEAARQAPSNPGIHYRLGLAYLKNGDKAKARRSIEHALAMKSPFTEADAARRTLATL